MISRISLGFSLYLLLFLNNLILLLEIVPVVPRPIKLYENAKEVPRFSFARVCSSKCVAVILLALNILLWVKFMHAGF